MIALDVLRAASRSPQSLEMFQAELSSARGIDGRLDRTIDRAGDLVGRETDLEAGARRVVEGLAVVWAGALLARFGEPAVFDAFAASRLEGDGGRLYGTLPAGLDLPQLLARAVPA